MERKEAKRILWLTDLHMVDASKYAIKEFFENMAVQACDAICITGDISDGYRFIDFLKRIYNFSFQKTIYFVLGNHDYFYSSIRDTRRLARELSKEYPEIHYLTDLGLLEINRECAIVGHDSWPDGRFGVLSEDSMFFRDFFCIEDFIGLNFEQARKKMMELGDEASEYFKECLDRGFQRYRKILLLTHVPPFEEACGDKKDGYFISESVGEALKEVMEKYFSCELTVLCGHSHSSSNFSALPNLHVSSGESEVGFPGVQKVIYF